MLIEALITAFVIAFVAIAVLGHVLLAQAVFTSAKARDPSQDDRQASHQAPITRARIAA
jgi:hypothetical protein